MEENKRVSRKKGLCEERRRKRQERVQRKERKCLHEERLRREI